MNIQKLIEQLSEYLPSPDVCISTKEYGEKNTLVLCGSIIDRGNGYIEISPLCGSDRGIQPIDPSIPKGRK